MKLPFAPEPGESIDTALESSPGISADAEPKGPRTDPDKVERPENHHLGARFKLEVLYTEQFSINKNNEGIISIWGSGGKAMPLADWKIYECPSEDRGGPPCDGLITPATHGWEVTACPNCHSAWSPKQLTGERYFKMPVENWCNVLFRYMHRLDMDADIYLKRLKSKLSIIEANEREHNKQLGGEVLKAARDIEAVIYARDRLLKDTLAGTPLKSAIRAFLLA
jgi:hypothetical protein